MYPEYVGGRIDLDTQLLSTAMHAFEYISVNVLILMKVIDIM